MNKIILYGLLVSGCWLSGSLIASSCYSLYDIIGDDELRRFFEPSENTVTSSGLAFDLKSRSFRTYDLRNICITQTKAIGSGTHGQVFSGELLGGDSTNGAMVFKTVHSSASIQSDRYLYDYNKMNYMALEREVRIQKKIETHPNILTFREAYYFKPSNESCRVVVLAFSMDRLGKTLGDRAIEIFHVKHLHYHTLDAFYGWLTGDQITAIQMAKYIAQVLSGIEHLLGKGLLNIDLYPENIMFDEADNIKLIDFSRVNEYDLQISVEKEKMHEDFKENIGSTLTISFGLLMKAATLTQDDEIFFSEIFGSLSALSDDSVSILQRDYILRATIESLEDYQQRHKAQP